MHITGRVAFVSILKLATILPLPNANEMIPEVGDADYGDIGVG